MLILGIALFITSFALATYNFTRVPKSFIGFCFQYLNFHIVFASGLFVALILSKHI